MEINNRVIFGMLCGIALIMSILFMQIQSVGVGTNTLIQDLNVLKSNDLAMVQYIQYNSQTLEYINNNCRVTSDNNEVTVLTCIKVKQ